MKNILVFCGSYSRRLTLGTGEVVPGTGDGISVFRMDETTGKLTKLWTYPSEANPTYLAVDATGRFLYANHELKSYRGLECGAVSAYRVDEKTGALAYINSQISGGTDACHVALDKTERYVLTANFMSGSVCVFPREKTGALCKPTCFLQHRGSSIDAKRQTGPHAHQICFDRQNKRVFVPDLGTDEAAVYRFDTEKGYLIPENVPYPRTLPGMGPRHMVFHPSGKFFYLINEMGNTVYTFSYQEETGESKELQVLSTIPEGFSGHTTTSALKLHPNGTFLYGSNRGHDSIAIYRVGKDMGRLTLAAVQSAGGKTPRDFDIDPSGTFLVCGNQDSDTVTVFRINKESGMLTQVYKEENAPAVTAVLIHVYES